MSYKNRPTSIHPNGRPISKLYAAPYDRAELERQRKKEQEMFDNERELKNRRRQKLAESNDKDAERRIARQRRITQGQVR